MNLIKMLSSLMIILVNHNKKDNNQDCITYTIGEGTGCQFMCDYCTENLGTTDFYFTDWVCQNKNGMCTGDPIAWETYTCCTNQ